MCEFKNNKMANDGSFNCMERIEQKYIQEDDRESTHYPQPSTNLPILLFIITMILTSCATILTCLSLMTNYWEYISWDIRKVDEIKAKARKDINAPPYVKVEPLPLLDETLVKIVIEDFSPKNKTDTNYEPSTIYLVPMHGGIWTLCVSLNGKTSQHSD